MGSDAGAARACRQGGAVTGSVDPGAGVGVGAVPRDLAITLVALALLLAWDASGLDLRIVSWFGTPAGFALRDHWFTAALLHGGGRWVSGVALAAVALNAVRPLGPARGLQRGVRLWWLATTLLCLVLIPYIKSKSHISCPWDLVQFGGAAQYLSHDTWAAWAAPGDGGPGRCFPSGHASGAFAFLAGWFALRGHAARAARVWLAAVLALGLLFGAAQLARGAHYPSHTLWTAWICWAIGAAAWHAARRLRRGGAAAVAPHGD